MRGRELEVSCGEDLKLGGEVVGLRGGDTAAVTSAPVVAWWLFGGVALVITLLDQVFKTWIRGAIPFGGKLDLVPGWVHLTHTLNHGAAWSMLSGQRWLLILISIGVSIFVVRLTKELAPHGKLPVLSLGLIFGGAIGNLIDRISIGAVTDMIDLDTPISFLRTFPVFNIADSALTVGVILLIIFFLLNQEKPTDKATE